MLKRNAATLLVGVLVLLPGCSVTDGNAEPERQQLTNFGRGRTVEVLWPEGLPVDDVGTDDAEAVDVLREWDLRLNASRWTHDYSDARLMEIASEDIRTLVMAGLPLEEARQVREGTAWSIYYPMGPTPMIVRSVRNEARDVLVEICRGTGWWNSEEPSSTQAWRERSGVVETFTMSPLGDSYVVQHRTSSLEECDMTGAKFGLFDSPSPPYGGPLEFEDIVMWDGTTLTSELAAGIP